jgi:hypothetical protein
MIIRIIETTTTEDTKLYEVWLITDEGSVSIAPKHESLYYVTRLAGRVKELLSAKTPENIRIDYPVGMGTHSDVVVRTLDAIERPRGESLEEAFTTKSREGTQTMQSGKIDIDAPNFSGAALEVYEETYRPFKPFFPKLAFSPAGTLAGIKLQVQNVQERITDLDAYREFINAVDDLVSGMAEDHVARLEEKEAKGNAQGSPKKLGAMEVTMIRQWRQSGYRGENYLQYLEGIVDRLAGDELN